MKAWRFSTDEFPQAERQSAWREAMGRLGLPIGDIPDRGAPFSGRVSFAASPMGIEFALVESGPQAIQGRYPKQDAAVWLTVLIDGAATLESDALRVAMTPGTMIYGPTGAPATLRFTETFGALCVKAPHVALNPRLLSPMAFRLGAMTGALPAERILFKLLRAAADDIDTMTTELLRPVELAVTEFLIACFAAENGPIAIGRLGGVRAMHLHRLCQTIETLLNDPALTPERVAAEQGVSPRYMQKLFSAAGETFSQYVKSRRLERCRAELASPAHANASISDICFRWGFNGSAHFSRAFREAYGQSPRDYRRASVSQA